MKRLFAGLKRPSPLKRTVFFCAVDIAIIAFSLFLASLFYFDSNTQVNSIHQFIKIVPFFIIIKLAIFAVFRIYQISWRHVSINDLLNIVVALILAEFFLVMISLPYALLPPLPVSGFSKRIFFVDGIISLFLIGGFRISKRLYLEVLRKKGFARNKGKQAVILGAGNTGEMILRDMTRFSDNSFYPVAFLDDDKNKVGTYIHGVKVQGELDDLSLLLAEGGIEAVIIAIPRLNHMKLKEIYDVVKSANINAIKIVPRIYDFEKPDLNLKSLEDISIEDLIGRQIVQIDYAVVRDFLKDKTVLVTGAGGSIGSELVMQICAFQPEKVVLFDIDDTDLHNMMLKVNDRYGLLKDRIHFIIGDVRDEKRVSEVFHRFRPQIVFHAAAYKHVPMMEHNPLEAVKVNIFGTFVVARISMDYNVERFIMISTDKAVRPTSIMGATKRMAEYVCQALNESNLCSTRFTSVRFGNVLGSRGSVIPLFLEQLKHGGPLTVTHKDMVRFFMTIPEAVSLILQASTMGGGGEVFVLDMGEPVKIVELAEELIKIQGLRPYRDIDIEFTGIRPGEKIFEEILTAEEGTIASKHSKVFIARNGVKYSLSEIEDILHEFENLMVEPLSDSERHVRDILKKYVRHYEVH